MSSTITPGGGNENTGGVQQQPTVPNPTHDDARGVKPTTPKPQTRNPLGETTNVTTTTPASALKVKVVVPNLAKGSIASNTEVMVGHLQDAVAEHKTHGSEHEHLILHAPELSITGYDKGDLFQAEPGEFNKQIEGSLKRIMEETTEKKTGLKGGASVTVGFPFYTATGDRVILHGIISNGKLISIKGKEDLANNIGSNRGVEYEVRYFVPCKPGTQIHLFGGDYYYETGKRTEGNIFCDQSVMIAGKRVATVICEEMFTGADGMGPLSDKLEKHTSDYMKEVFGNVIPGHHIEDSEYSAIRKLILSSFMPFDPNDRDAPSSALFNQNPAGQIAAYLENRLSNESKKHLTHEVLLKLESELKNTIDAYKSEHLKMQEEGEMKIREEIRKDNKLCNRLKDADVVFVPNGSPSAAGKYLRRENLLRNIGEAFREETMEEGGTPRQVYYSNHHGTPGGAVNFDGTVIMLDVSNNATEVRHLNTYHYGLVDAADSVRTSRPHWTTADGLNTIIDLVNDTEYYSGKIQYTIQFADTVRNIYPRFYQEVEFAYDNLKQHVKASLEPGETIFERGSKKYMGHFISQSGGFDSAHTVLVRAMGIEVQMRKLVKSLGSVSRSLDTMVNDLGLAHRGVDFDAFKARFLMLKVNDGDIKNEKLVYKNLENMCKALGIAIPQEGINDNNAAGIAAKVTGSLQGNKDIKTIADLLKFLDAQLPEGSDAEKNAKIALLSKVVIFHTVKAAYLRTENNSITSEKAARSLAQELGADFEVRDVDNDFKTALLLEKGLDLAKFSTSGQAELMNIYNKIMRIGKRQDRLDQIAELEAKKDLLLHPSTTKKYDFTVEEIDARIAEIKEEIVSDEKKLGELKNELQEKVRELANKDNIPQYQNYVANVHNWFESVTGLEIENVQARVRASLNWEMGAQFGLMPSSNPNTDEGKQGYTTFDGDEHAGKDSSTSDMRKSEIHAEMALLMNGGLWDDTQFFGSVAPVKAIVNTFGLPPSAELQQLGKNKLQPQQTDEDSYGMSYFVLSLVGDKLFELSQDGGHFVHIGEVFEKLKDHPVFHGHSEWETYAKIDKVYRQWYFAAFKRRAAPWQMSNSDVSVDHHLNNRTEFAGFDNAIRHERAELLLTLLIDQGIIKADATQKDALKKALLVNPDFQVQLNNVFWNGKAQPDDLKILIKRYKDNPDLLNEKILARVKEFSPRLLEPAQFLEVKAPAPPANIDNIKVEAKGTVAAIPISTKARDIAGNVEEAKKAILIAQAKGMTTLVIPDILGADLGDNLRRVSQSDIQVMLDEITKFAKEKAPSMTVVVGHPEFNAATPDRSRRYYQSASVISNGAVVQTFRANKIDNNRNRPGASYNTRTFQAYDGVTAEGGERLSADEVRNLRTTAMINGKETYVLVGESVPPEWVINERIPVIHIGAMEADDQLRAVENIAGRGNLAISANAVGSSSGIRSFNGRVITNAAAVKTFREHDQSPQAQLDRDALWLKDYLPAWGKVTINLDGPEAIYTLKVMKRALEMRLGRPCTLQDFNNSVEVVAPYFRGQKEAVSKLWEAANESLGFELPRVGKDRKGQERSNEYEIDTFKTMFLRNALIGDLNISNFKNLSPDDPWHAVDAFLKKVVEENYKPTEEDLKRLRANLEKSEAYINSIGETYRREGKTLNDGIQGFKTYRDMQIDLMIGRVRNYYAHPETGDRLQGVFAWLISARDGGEGQIILNNMSRNDLCCAKQDLFGGRLHAGGVNVTASHSLEAMKEMIGGEKTKAIFEAKMKEEIVPGLTRAMVDNIYEYIRDNNFAIKDILDAPFFRGMKDEQKLDILKKFAKQWELNVWDRHAVACGPHTEYSIDQQTSFREPLRATWLSDQISVLERRMKQVAAK